MKTCSRCEGYKTLASFRKCKRSKDGFDWWCKNCRSDYEGPRRVVKTKSRVNRKNHDVPPKPFELSDIFKRSEAA